MKIGLLLLLLALLASMFRPPARFGGRPPGKSGMSPQTSALSWLVGISVLAALLIPGRTRLLLLIPALVAAAVLLKSWRGRTRLRQENAASVDFAKMKRVYPTNDPAAFGNRRERGYSPP